MSPAAPPPDAVLSVSEITERIHRALATELGDVWVRGELSRVTYASSGHIYLSLKDQNAVLGAAIWRSTARRVRFRLEEGQEVIAHGRIDVYAPRGSYSLIVSSVEPLGEGALRLAFEQLRRRLEDEGLFAPERKRPLPAFPRRVAVVTSPTGAAVRDLVTVMQRRFPALEIVLVPTRVQGEGASAEIAEALAFADARARADVIVVGRGGGSLEDLWCFNEEGVARAIAACDTPVVSAVGHETDVTIADLVADVRAATPSQAGELVVPDRAELLGQLGTAAERLRRSLRGRLDYAWQRVEALGDRPVLRDPRGYVEIRRARLASLVGDRGERVSAAALRIWRRARDRTDLLDARLRALSPLAVLGRGYSLTRAGDGRVVRGVVGVRPGEVITTRLADGGELDSRVEDVRPASGGDET